MYNTPSPSFPSKTFITPFYTRLLASSPFLAPLCKPSHTTQLLSSSCKKYSQSTEVAPQPKYPSRSSTTQQHDPHTRMCSPEGPGMWCRLSRCSTCYLFSISLAIVCLYSQKTMHIHCAFMWMLQHSVDEGRKGGGSEKLTRWRHTPIQRNIQPILRSQSRIRTLELDMHHLCRWRWRRC